jgi:acetylornithine deacetylase
MNDSFPTLTEMMSALIATPSVSSVNTGWDQSNLAVIELLDGWLSSAGFQTEVMPIPGHPDKANLIATLGSGPDGLVLAGHTDTVPFDGELWKYDPLKLTEIDGRFYGLGTSDMKSFFALALEAARDLEAKQLKRPLIILATADEESSMSGAKALVDANCRMGRYAIIGEPTGLKPVRMHKGISMESVRLTGQSGHSSDPSLGNNAMEGMYKVMGNILDWRRELQQRYRNPLFAIEVPTLNLGHIHGGDNPNRICGHCELQFDLRPLPGMDILTLRGELQQRLEQELADSNLKLEMIPVFDGIPAMETPADSRIVKAVEQLTSHTAEAVAFGTEAPYLRDLGIETLILGPGDIAQAHQPDEYLSTQRVSPTIKLLQSVIQQFCLS